MSSGDKAQEIIAWLAERFHEHSGAYTSGAYNETQLRREFLDPFFEALGWDVNNTQGYAEAYKDVIHEDAIKVGGATKAPDYCFRIGGTRKFFVEAKNPSVNLRDDISPAFQLRRYAWSAKLPLSVLTDFEEFAVYDCRYRPEKTDKASRGRVIYLTYKDYLDRWEEIAAIFARESVLKGSFDKYAETGRHKRGTAEVDDAFLREIESWRDVLAKNIALRNPRLTQRELNFSVQRTIDRMVFLRICEDRSIEDYGKLQALQSGANVYRRMVQLYRQADDKYNSGLFHFEEERDRPEPPDELTPALKIDDKHLKEIIKRLYYPDSPYEFSVLPADILGQVYEQFLGKVIRLTPGHRAVVEEKPEVRKAGGVYYTPTYIVDYIVKNTVGRLTEGSTPKKVEKLCILDPACGSGSFLLGAYQYLLDWHREWYEANDPKKHAKGKSPKLYQAGGGEWRLTTAEKKRILLNNIYGVDIDSQAVEVTKLSLLLKVLEGESEETLLKQYQLFKERALPDLRNNIKCGNSLIGPDFYEGRDMALFDEEEHYRINVFDWQSEYPEIMKNGGFDAVIGNPPYVRQEGLGEFKEYFQKDYKVYHGTADLYAYFIERGISLLNSAGMFGYIVANKWMRANYGETLRHWLKKQGIREIIDFGDLPVFKKATTYPCIMTVRKDGPSKGFSVTQVKTLDFDSIAEYVKENCFNVNSSNLDDKGWSLVDEKEHALLDKLRTVGVSLKEYVDGKIYRGVLTGLNEAFVIDKVTRDRLIAEHPRSAEIIKPFLAGRDIKRYQEPKSKKYLLFTRRGIDIEKYPAIKKYLSEFKERLMPKPKGWKGEKWKGRKPGAYQWYEIQDTIDYYAEFEKPKIMLPDISLKGNFTYDDEGNYCVNTSYIITNIDKYLLGLLNSNITNFVYKEMSPSYRGGYLRFIYQYLIQLPIRKINFSDLEDKARHDRMVALVEQMLELNKKLQAAKTGHEQNALKRQIEYTDRQIDSLVYKLYGLTEEEIKIVEEEE
jgi:type I restriction-modification system DNA methylase subunit/predicted type IV restriction endonuclease